MIHGFGDIFRYNEELYVFLAATDEIIYAAKILDPDTVEQIEILNNKRASKHDAEKSDGNKLFWYVVLTTEDFKNHAAHLAKTDQDATKDQYFDWIGKTLNESDSTELRIEILKDGSPVPKGLKEIVATFS